MSLTISTILAAAEAAAEPEKSKTLFFVAGVILVSFAIIISVFGFTRPDFPGDARTARGVMALSVALVATAMFSIVYVST
jgi:hypothetical protein